MINPEKCLTISVEEAGELLGLSRPSAYAAARNGQLPVLKIGRRLLVPKIQFLQMLNKTENKPADRQN